MSFYAANGMVLLQNPRGLHCYSSSGACHKTLHLSYHQHLQHHKICWIVWPKWGYLHCNMDLSYSKLAAVCVTQYMEQYLYNRFGICCLQKPNRPTRRCVSFFVVTNARCRNFVLLWRGIPCHASDPWTPKNFTEGSDSWIFIEFSSPTLWNTVAYQGL